MEHKFAQIGLLKRLPAIPVIANEIIQCVSDPDTSVEQLAALIEKDPSLAAQIMRYARSALFGYQGEIDSLSTAITRVLGFDIVSNIAFGIASSKAFKLPVAGPLGMASLWHQSLMAAALAQKLARKYPALQISPGSAYLACLLQHFGFFTLGHVFPDEYEQLNASVQQSSHLYESLLELEWQDAPAVAGAQLLESWNMPADIVQVVRYLYTGQASGEQAQFVNFVRAVNGLLAEQGIGLPGMDWRFGADEYQLPIETDLCRPVLEQLLNETQSIDSLVEKLVAGQ